MGILQKLVYIIHKLDPDNTKWKQLQIDKANEIPDRSSRDVAIAAIERDFAENEDDECLMNEVVVTDATNNVIDHAFETRFVGEYQPKGISRKVGCYELIGLCFLLQR